jgi:hypothetical protein
MPTHRPKLRWTAAAIAVLVAVGALAWVLQRDAGTDTTPSARSTAVGSALPSAATAEPTGQVSSTTPGPTTSATDGPTDTSTGHSSGPTDGRSPGNVRGNGGRTSPGGSAPGGGAPSGVTCWGTSEHAPVSPVPGDATTTEVRHQVAANLQLLREVSPPPALTEDVEGLRSYYRRVGQVVGADGRDGPLGAEDEDRIEQLTQDVYAKFAPAVVNFLSRRC